MGGRLVMPVGPLIPLNTSRSSKKSPLARRQCAPMSGLELLPKAIRPDVPIIMITPMAMLKPSAGRLRAAPTRLRERNPVLNKDKTRIWLARIIKPLAGAPYRHRERVFNPDRKESRGSVQPDVSQPISPPALAPPPVQSRVCPGYRIERTELGAAGGADSGFARIKLSSPWRNRNCPDSINWFNKRAVGRGWHAIRLLRCSRTLQRGSGVLLSTNRLLFWSRGFGLGNREGEEKTRHKNALWRVGIGSKRWVDK